MIESPKKIIALLKKAGYINLTIDTYWDRVIQRSLLKEESIENNIEDLMLKGIQNVLKLTFQAEKFFSANKQKHFEQYSENEQKMIKQYFILLICGIGIKLNPAIINDKLMTVIDYIAENALLGEEYKDLKSIFELLLLPFLWEDYSAFINVFQQPGWEKQCTRMFLKKIENNKERLSFYQNIEEELFVQLSHYRVKHNMDWLPTIIQWFYWFRTNYFYANEKSVYGYYQRVIDKMSGMVLYSIPYNNQMFLLQGSSAVIAAKANLETIEVLDENSFLLRFKRGRFLDERMNERAALNAALLIQEAFTHYLVSSKDKTMQWFIEAPDDNAHFAELILEQLFYLEPDFKSHVCTIPCLGSKVEERIRYLSSENVSLESAYLKKITEMMQSVGQKKHFVLSERAFRGVKKVSLKPREVLCAEGEKALFVYLPLSKGLEGISKTAVFFPKPWAPIGHIGVIQNSVRTATIIAVEQVEVLMIPGDIYLSFWHMEYTEEELKAALQ